MTRIGFWQSDNNYQPIKTGIYNLNSYLQNGVQQPHLSMHHFAVFAKCEEKIHDYSTYFWQDKVFTVYLSSANYPFLG